MGPGELDFRQEGFMLPKGGNDGSFCKADFICLSAVLGLRCCTDSSPAGASGSWSLFMVRRLLIAVAFLALEHSL